MKVTPEELQSIARLVNDLCGIVLDSGKGYLIESRLGSVARESGCQSFSELYYKARYENNPGLREKIIDAITTNETLFFRDTSPFEVLQHKVLPELIDAKSKTPFARRIRIWSAACSTGQEPYSISMILHELIGNLTGWDIQILATDISDAAVRQASLGIYGAHEIQRGMKMNLLDKCFVRDGQNFHAKDHLRGLIAFRKINLLQPLTAVGTFDIIFCRNVAIYFDSRTRRDLFLRLSDRLTSDGYLFVGSTESLSDIDPRFLPQHYCRAVYYQPNKLRPALCATT